MAGEYTRRRLLTAAGATVVGAGLGGVTRGRKSAREEPDSPYFGGWLDGVDGGIKDARGQSEVTVKVGAEGNGGPFAFSPAGLVIDPGTTVTFRWVSDTHDIAVESQPEGADWQGVTSIENTGFSNEFTFETEGIYKYYCQPHLSLGMKGAVLVGDADVPTGTPTPSGVVHGPDLEWLDGTPNYDGRVVDRRGRDQVTVTVGAENRWGATLMAPAAVWVDPGTTVRFRWATAQSLAVHTHPPTANWEGHPSTEDAGFEYSHTLETDGLYEYHGTPDDVRGAVLVGEAPTDPGEPVGGAEVAWRHRIQSEDSYDDLVEAEDALVRVEGTRVFALDKSSGAVRWERQNDTGYDVDTHDPVVDGTVYLTSALEAIALDVASGERQWRYRYEMVGNESLLDLKLIDGDVYLRGRRKIVALADDGSERWTFETDAPLADDWLVADGTIYAVVETSGSNDTRRLVALAADGGQLRWRTGVPDGSSPFDVAAGTVLLALFATSEEATGHLVGVDADSGEVRFERTAGMFLHGPVDPGRGRVYLPVVTGSGETREWAVQAIDLADGSVAWQVDVGQRYLPAPTLADGTLYVLTFPPEGGDGTLRAIGAADGTERWRTDFDPNGWYGPHVVGDSVCFGTDSHEVFALDADTGDRRWTFDTGGPVRGLRTHRNALLAQNDNGLFAFDPGDGRVNWRVEFDHATGLFDLFVDDDRVFPVGDTRLFGVTPGSTTRIPFGLPEGIPPAAVGLGGTIGTLLLGGLAWRYRTGGDDRSTGGGETPAAGGASSQPAADQTTTDTPGSSPPNADGAAETPPHDGLADRLDDLHERVGEAAPEIIDAPADARHRLQKLHEDLADLRDDAATHGVDDVQSEANSLSDAVDALVAAADDLEFARSRTEDARQASAPDDALAAYDDALVAYDDALAAYDDALEADASVDTGAIAEERETVEAERDAARRRRNLHARYDDLDDRVAAATDTVDTAPADAADRLEELAGDVAELAADAREHGLEVLVRDAETLAATCEDRAATARRRAMEPASIPHAPAMSLSYDQLDRGEPIGQGGNADVYRATVSVDRQSREVALKEPRLQGTLDSHVVEQFQREADTWSKLDDHDHVVGIIDYGSDPIPWIAMEYMDGGSLDQYAGELDLRAGVWTALAITEAVYHAHRNGVAHFDLKPANVLFRTVEDAWDVPKVGDWGLAKLMLDHSESVEGYTPAYAAPEQLKDSFGSTDQQTDIYAVGAVLYELFTGEPPFSGRVGEVVTQVLTEEPTPPAELEPALPDGLGAVITRALAKDKADRYEDIVLLREDLQDVYQGL